MMKAKILLVVLAGSTLAVAAATGGQAAPHGAATVSYLVQFQGATGVVDVPLNRPPNAVASDPHPGDELLSQSRVLDIHHHHIGRTSELCTMTVKHPATFDCSFNVLLNDGNELTVHGAINPMQNPWTAPVVGGTGRYAGAHGIIRATSTPDNPPAERWTFNLS
jgi:hypothetical protein